MPQHGRQPARDIAHEERWTLTRLAKHIDVPVTHLRGALYGITYPNDAIRERLPAVLGRPLSELFHPEMLVRRHQPHLTFAQKQALAAGDPK